MESQTNLNREQQLAAEHKNGPLLILAGAGAGKTRVLIHRIHNLIASGVAPEAILAVTFTNKAAKEMRERLRTLLNESSVLNRPIKNVTQPFVATFHGLCVQVLRDQARTLGIPRHFKILDRSDSIRLIKQAMKQCGIDSAQMEPRKILGTISKQKANILTATTYREQFDGEYYPMLVADVWDEYTKRLQDEKAFDFDDLLLQTVLLLQRNRSVLEQYQQQWQYLHVDEYQDTNTIQDELVALLAGETKNLCVVGDVDQTIYTWRGANPTNMLLFEKKYPSTTVIRLEENYRSTKNIIAASNEIIKHNLKRPEKTLYTKNHDGQSLLLYSALDELDEAAFVTEQVRTLLRSGIEPNEIAVLYRANFQSRVLEEACLHENVPYQIVGTRFFDRKEVKDVLAFLQLALNPASVSDLTRIVNVPPRGIGKITLMRMVANQEHECTPAVMKKIQMFRTLIDEIRTVSTTKPPSATIQHVVRASGLEEYLRNDDDAERLENIKELASLAAKYDALPPGEGIEALLTDAALATDQDELARNVPGVKLMTVHAAKGLEFDYVFIVGLEDGLFPHEGMYDETRDEEEERRLFYVALTRARQRVFLSFAHSRLIFGARRSNLPSAFLTDISDELLEVHGSEHLRPDAERTIYLDM